MAAVVTWAKYSRGEGFRGLGFREMAVEAEVTWANTLGGRGEGGGD